MFLEIPKRFQSKYVLYGCILIRLIVPIFLFQKVDPFWAMLINEAVIDGIFSPHHIPILFIPEDYRKYANHYYTDKPLDTWGFINSLQPVLLKNNKYYSQFEGYRNLLISFFSFRLIGVILFYLTRKIEMFMLFPNIFLTTYLIVSFFNKFFPGENKKVVDRWIAIGIIFSLLKEILIYTKMSGKAKENKDFIFQKGI